MFPSIIAHLNRVGVFLLAFPCALSLFPSFPAAAAAAAVVAAAGAGAGACRFAPLDFKPSSGRSWSLVRKQAVPHRVPEEDVVRDLTPQLPSRWWNTPRLPTMSRFLKPTTQAVIVLCALVFQCNEQWTFIAASCIPNATTCPAGTYFELVYMGQGCPDYYACYQCAYGQYTPEADLYSCLPWANDTSVCREGEGLEAGSSTSNASCLSCSNGYYVALDETGYNYCEPCPYYTFTPNATAEVPSYMACIDWTNPNGADTCLQNQGYQDGYESALQDGPSNRDQICFNCSGGYFVEYLDEMTDICAICSPGNFTPPESTASFQECIVCESGFFASDYGATSCGAWNATLTCDAGYYLDQGTPTRDHRCTECAYGQFQSQNNSNATSCTYWTVGDYYFCSEMEVYVPGSTTADDGCRNCDPGQMVFYESEFPVCVDCSRGRFGNGLDSYCPDCGPGYFANGTGQSECLTCQAGRYTADAGSWNCTKWSVDQCEAGYALNSSNVHDASCTQCENGRFQPDAGFSGSACFNWTYVSCDEVPDTFLIAPNASFGGACQNWTVTSCDAGFALYPPTSANDGECNECSYGYFQPDDNAAVESCSPWSAYDVTFCQSRGADVFEVAFEEGNTTADSICFYCPAGQYIDNQTGVCMDCSAGRFSHGANASHVNFECEQCSYGFFASEPRATRCEQWTSSCAAGSHLDGWPDATIDYACADCLEGFFQPDAASNATACTACSAGFFSAQPAASKCLGWSDGGCDPGTRYVAPNATSDVSCVACAHGRFQPYESSYLKTCSPWTYEGYWWMCPTQEFVYTAGNSTTDDSCDLCGAGNVLTIAEEQPSTCTPCNPGRFSRTSNASTCVACPVGRFANASAASECLPCAPGKYANDNSSNACHSCNDEQFLQYDINASIATGVCVNVTIAACPAGYALQRATSTSDGQCMECPPGFFQPTESSKESCSPWTFAASDDCLEPGTDLYDMVFVSGNTTRDADCVYCSPGFFTDRVEGSCQQCGPGRFARGSSSGNVQSECTECDIGRFSSLSGASECTEASFTECNAGFGLFQPNSSTDNECRECEWGFFQSAARFNGSCSTWTYPDEHACLDQDELFSTVFREGNSTKDSDCVYCEDGFFTDRVAGVCTQCGPGRFARGSSYGDVQSECSECELGRFAAETGASECTPGTVSSCGPGFGFHQPNSSTDTRCVPCEDGFFQPDYASTKTCAPWSLTAAVDCLEIGATLFDRVFVAGNATQDTGCDYCSAGKATDRLAGVCELCGPGRFARASSDIGVVTECEACDYGRFTRSSGSSSCDIATTLNCSAGSALAEAPSTTNDGVCAQCDPGFFQPERDSTSTECLVCTNGYSSQMGSTTCETWTVLSCAAGYQLRPPNATSDGRCTECDPGRFQPVADSQSSTCTSWTYTHSECEAGFDVDLNLGKVFTAGSTVHDSTCDYCPAGQLANATVTAVGLSIKCSECPPGRFSTGLFQGQVCRVCDAGTVAWPVDGGATECVVDSTSSPPVTTTAVTTTTAFEGCAPGYFAQEAGNAVGDGDLGDLIGSITSTLSCVECPEGRFQPSPASSSTQCEEWADPRPCPAGTAVALGSTTSDALCEGCPLGRFARAPENVSSAVGIAWFEEEEFTTCELCPEILTPVQYLSTSSNGDAKVGECSTCSEFSSVDDATDAGALRWLDIAEDDDDDIPMLACNSYCNEAAARACNSQRVFVKLTTEGIEVDTTTPNAWNGSNTSYSRRQLSVLTPAAWPDAWLTAIASTFAYHFASELSLSVLDVAGELSVVGGEDSTTLQLSLSVMVPTASESLTANTLINALEAAGIDEGSSFEFDFGFSIGPISLGVLEVEIEGIEIIPVSCPENSIGNGEGSRCRCEEGYTGTIIWVAYGSVRQYRGSCVAASSGVAVSWAVTVASVAVTSSVAAGTGVAASAAGLSTGASMSTGASFSVIASMQNYALLCHVPAVYTRMPTFTAFFKGTAWTNLQGMPGWWWPDPNATNSTLPNGTASSRRRRRLEGSDAAETSSVASYFNCSMAVADSWNETWVEDDAMSMAPDMIGDIYSNWFYSVILIMAIVIGHHFVAMLVTCSINNISLEKQVARSVEVVLGQLLEDHMRASGDETPFNTTAVASIRSRLSKRHDEFVQPTPHASPRAGQSPDDPKQKKNEDCFATLLNKGIYGLLNSLFVRCTDVEPDFKFRDLVLSCFDWSLVDRQRPGKIAYRKGRHPLQMKKNATAFALHFVDDAANEAALQAAEDAATLKKMWSAPWFFGSDTPTDKSKDQSQSPTSLKEGAVSAAEGAGTGAGADADAEMGFVETNRLFRATLRKVVAEFFAAAEEAELLRRSSSFTDFGYKNAEQETAEALRRSRSRLEMYVATIKSHSEFFRPNAIPLARAQGKQQLTKLLSWKSHAKKNSEGDEDSGPGDITHPEQQLGQSTATPSQVEVPENLGAAHNDANVHGGDDSKNAKQNAERRPVVGDRVVSVHPNAETYRSGQAATIIADDHDSKPYRLKFDDGVVLEFFAESEVRLLLGSPKAPNIVDEPLEEDVENSHKDAEMDPTGIDDAEALRRLQVDQAKMLMLDYSRLPLKIAQREKSLLYYNPLWYIRLLTFLFASAVQVATTSVFLGQTSFSNEGWTMESLAMIIVGGVFFFVFGIVYQSLSLFHLCQSLYKKRYAHYDAASHTWVDTTQHVYHPMWLALYDRYRDSDSWHPFFYRSVYFLLLFAKSVVTALGTTGTNAINKATDYEGISADGGWTMNPLWQLYTLLGLEILDLLAFSVSRCPFATFSFNIIFPLRMLVQIAFFSIILFYYDRSEACQLPDMYEEIFMGLTLAVTVMPIAAVVFAFLEDCIRGMVRKAKKRRVKEKRRQTLIGSVRRSLNLASLGDGSGASGGAGVEMVSLAVKNAECK